MSTPKALLIISLAIVATVIVLQFASGEWEWPYVWAWEQKQSKPVVIVQSTPPVVRRSTATKELEVANGSGNDSSRIYYPEEIDRAFARNEIRAEATYDGYIRLEGRISGIETNLWGGARFQLYGVTGASIQCGVPEEYKNGFVYLDPGERVIVSAEGPSIILGGVVFHSCRFESYPRG